MSRRVILWDNDGVLVDTERFYFAATRIVLAEKGIGLDSEQYRELFLTRSGGAFHLARERGVGEHEITLMRERRNSLYARFLQEEEYLDPGIEGLLASVSSKARMGVVTSSRREHFRIIHSRTGFGRFFECVVTWDDVRQTKPHPEPYLRALELLGCSAEGCVAVEDSERGLKAAKAAGLECWVVPTELTGTCSFSGADKVLESVRQVTDLL
jgi:HAD superfamily hydrolase (TIGR01509 family)